MKLKKLKRESEQSRKKRLEMKTKIEKICQENDPISDDLKSFNRQVTGRPRKEADQPELLSTIVKVVEASSAAHDRWRCENLWFAKNTWRFTRWINTPWFQQSATYLRLLPRLGNSKEGKRHVQTVKVKLVRPENSLRKKNADHMFAKAFIDDMFDLCELFGPEAVQILSIDDKARVKLGLAAASLQAPVLMSMDYKVWLPDHSFVVGERHSLIPSVYGICNVNEKGLLTYSGDTFIRIRSGKHDSSTPYTHAHDVRELFQCNSVNHKPILLLMSDGASDEAPRFLKPLSTAVSLFKEFKLDALMHGVNAAGLSAFNPVERRMAPLSHDLAGVILPHDSFGSHLDNSMKTINLEASEVLSEIWSKTVIDRHPVDSEAVPLGQEFILPTPDAKWVAKHVRQTRYSLQLWNVKI